MASHKSSVKRAITSEKKRDHSSRYMTSVRTTIKKLQFALNGIKAGTDKSDTAQLTNLFKNAQVALAKAATKGIIHKKNSSRRIGRLAAAVKSASVKK